MFYLSPLLGSGGYQTSTSQPPHQTGSTGYPQSGGQQQAYPAGSHVGIITGCITCRLLIKFVYAFAMCPYYKFTFRGLQPTTFVSNKCFLRSHKRVDFNTKVP